MKSDWDDYTCSDPNLNKPSIIKTLALAACAFGLLVLIVYMVLLPTFILNRTRLGCLREQQNAHRMMMEYGESFDDHFPDPPQWMDQLGSWDDFKNKRDRSRLFFRLDAIAMNDFYLKKRSDIRDPSRTPEVFDCTSFYRNAHGGLELLPNPPHHRKNIIIYVDGHYRFVDGKGH